MIQGRKRYIFKIQNPKNENDFFDVYEWGDTRIETQEKVKKQYFEKDVIYVGRKDFDDSILSMADEMLNKVEETPTEIEEENSDLLEDFNE